MEKKVIQGEVQRKRGRPAGKNRVPLSKEERRARNAQYERERRVEMSEALAELAAAAGCSSSMPTADLLATVITQIQQASRVKHSSDLESLRRCNKNLMAQIETLERRQLAEPDRDVPVKVEEVAETPRPFTRKRGNLEDKTEDAVFISVPANSPPEYKCTPPANPPEQQYLLPEPLPSSNFTEPHLNPELNHLVDSNFLAFYEQSLSAEPAQEYEHMDWQYPNSSAVPNQEFMPGQEFMPVPRISPRSNSPDHLSGEQAAVDISSYIFAGSEIPTPVYHIASEPLEKILPDEQSYFQVEFDDQTSPQQLLSRLYSPDRPYSPSDYIIREPHCAAAANQQQPTNQAAVQPNVVASVEIAPMPEASSSAGTINPEQELLMSSQEFISSYLESC